MSLDPRPKSLKLVAKIVFTISGSMVLMNDFPIMPTIVSINTVR